VRYHLRNIQK